MDETELGELAHAWIRLHRDGYSAKEGKDFWAFETLADLVRSDPEIAWRAIEAIRHLDSSDRVLANLAAGPLEDLLVHHGAQFIERIELLARTDAQFRHLLGGVWQNDIPEDIWARVRAVAGPSW